MRAAVLAVAAFYGATWVFNQLALWAHRRQAVRAAEQLLQEIRA